jgi:alpha-1,2-mannosyltransferase
MVNHHDAFFFTMHYHYYFGDLIYRVQNLDTLRRTGNIYVPFGDGAFTYPPGAILFFWPILWVPTAHLTLLWTFTSLVALAASFFVALDFVTRGRRVWLAGISLWAACVAAAIFPEVTECLTWGQTATILLLLILVDLFVLRAPLQGVLVGLATAVKIYPGLFIVMWLLRRQWRPALTALATCFTLTAVAWILWPVSGRAFFHDLVLHGKEYEKLANSHNAVKSNSLIAFFMRPPFHYGFLGSHVNLLLSLLVMGVALWAGQRLWRAGLEFSAAVVVMIGSTLATPAAWDHYFSFLPLLVLVAWEAGLDTTFGRVSLIATAVGIGPWFLFRTPASTSAWAVIYSFVARNALLLATVSVLVAALADGRLHRGAHEAARGSPAALTR